MQYRAASSKKNRRARLIGFCPILTHDLFDASDCPALQTDFDPMWMSGRFCEDILHDTPGQFSGRLILLQDNENRHAGFNGGAGLSVHGMVLRSGKVSYIQRSIAQQ